MKSKYIPKILDAPDKRLCIDIRCKGLKAGEYMPSYIAAELLSWNKDFHLAIKAAQRSLAYRSAPQDYKQPFGYLGGPPFSDSQIQKSMLVEKAAEAITLRFRLPNEWLPQVRGAILSNTLFVKPEYPVVFAIRDHTILGYSAPYEPNGTKYPAIFITSKVKPSRLADIIENRWKDLSFITNSLQQTPKPRVNFSTYFWGVLYWKATIEKIPISEVVDKSFEKHVSSTTKYLQSHLQGLTISAPKLECDPTANELAHWFSRFAAAVAQIPR